METSHSDRPAGSQRTYQNDTRLHEESVRLREHYIQIGRVLDAAMQQHRVDTQEVIGLIERYANFRDTFGPK